MTVCDRVEGLLVPYADVDLAPEEKALVERHLEGCPSCAALAAGLTSAGEAFAAFPEIEPGPALMAKLRAVPERRRFRFSLEFLLRPSLQPVFAVASIVAVAFSLYMASPDKKRIEQAVNRQLHRGYSAFEKLTAKAGAAADSLGAAADSLYVSIKTFNPLGKTDKSSQ
jgi:anti-sigma factor RsiW